MQLIYITHRKLGLNHGPIYAACGTVKQVCKPKTVFINIESGDVFTLQDIGAGRTITCADGQAIIISRPQPSGKAHDNGKAITIPKPDKLSIRPVKIGEATPYDKQQLDKWLAKVRNIPFPPVFECEERFPGNDGVYLLPGTYRKDAINTENPIFIHKGESFTLEDKDFVVTQDRAFLRIVGDPDIGQYIKPLEPEFDEASLDQRLGRNSRD